MIRVASALALSLTLVTVSPASAHRMRIFATAEGTMIFGRAYFSADSPAISVDVRAETTDGATVYTGRTDADGRFRFNATQRADHRLIADAGDGHQARFIISAAELSPTLPASGAVVSDTVDGATPETAVAPRPAASCAAAAAVESAVARQVTPLREELAAHEESVGWRDVVGGLGYIIGLGGLAYGLSVRKAEKGGNA